MSLASHQSILECDKVWILNINQYLLWFFSDWSQQKRILFSQFRAVENHNKYYLIFNIQTLLYSKLDWDAKDMT